MILFNPPVKQPTLICATVRGINSHLEINGHVATVYAVCLISILFVIYFKYVVPQNLKYFLIHSHI